MTIAFPTLSRADAGNLAWYLQSNTQTFESPLDKTVQTLELPGARWGFSCTWANLLEADAALLQAFLVRLRGRSGRFTAHNWARPRPRGTCALSGVTLAAAAALGDTAASLAGCGAGATLLAGDFIGIGGELKMVVADATADGSGTLAATFEPPLRAAAGAGDAVTTEKPTATFMLDEDRTSWTTGAAVITDVALAATEAF